MFLIFSMWIGEIKENGSSNRIIFFLDFKIKYVSITLISPLESLLILVFSYKEKVSNSAIKSIHETLNKLNILEVVKFLGISWCWGKYAISDALNKVFFDVFHLF